MSEVVTEGLGRFDVLVVGGGIAGTVAALSAAEQGAKVALACSGPLFGGSSFFAGTWGLGLVGPVPGGETDFERAILEVGQGMAGPALVHALVSGIEPGIEWLEGLGCRPRRARAATEREFIPCFDHAQRDWHGLEREAFREAMGAALERSCVTAFPHMELLAPGTFFDRSHGIVCGIDAKSTVLATGGFGGLFERTLTTPENLGAAQAIALEQGASLVNCEFMQIMPGLVAPVRDVVFNEKTFRFAHVDGVPGPGATALLDARSCHGPFTASRPDREVDFAIAAAGDGGARVTYHLPGELPEFMRTYADWLRRDHGIEPGDELRVAHYAHAHNGGILIGADAAVEGAPGIYACGECTGGMHGADRIGGLASASALVFGRIAGREAAWCGAERPTAARRPLRAMASPRAEAALTGLRRTMSRACMVFRTEAGLRSALDSIYGARERISAEAEGSDDARAIAATRRAELALEAAWALVCAMRARAESRGAHYRADVPGPDAAQARPNALRFSPGADHGEASAFGSFAAAPVALP